MVSEIKEKVCVGCTFKKAAWRYYNTLGTLCRPMFYIDGSVSFKKRIKIINEFESTVNGILVCTQQSLESSVNIPNTDHCFIESLPWNYSRLSQFFARFSRLNSKRKTKVYFVNYERSIENSLLSLILAKERIAKAVKLEEVKNQKEMFDLFNLDWINEFMETSFNESENRYQLGWTSQKIK